MKKYFFTKDLILGTVQLSVKRGQSVVEKNGCFEYEKHKYQNSKDFQIAIKYGWLVQQNDFDGSKKSVAKEKETAVANSYGFQVKKESVQDVIPLKKFVELNEKEGYVEDDGNIIPIEETEIHVAKEQNTNIKIEQNTNTETEQNTNTETEQQPQIDLQEVKFQQNKEEQSINEEVVVQQKEETPKATKTNGKKTTKTNGKKAEKTVRGMKIIQGD